MCSPNYKLVKAIFYNAKKENENIRATVFSVYVRCKEHPDRKRANQNKNKLGLKYLISSQLHNSVSIYPEKQTEIHHVNKT